MCGCLRVKVCWKHALTHFNIISLHFSFLGLMFTFLSLKLGGEPQGWTNVYGVLKGTNLFCYHQKEDMEANVEPVLTIGINKVSSVLFWKLQACSFEHMIHQGHSSAFGDIMRYFSLWISWKHSFKWIGSIERDVFFVWVFFIASVVMKRRFVFHALGLDLSVPLESCVSWAQRACFNIWELHCESAHSSALRWLLCSAHTLLVLCCHLLVRTEMVI